MNEMAANIIVAFFTALFTAVATSFLYSRKAKADLQKEYKSRFNERRWEVYSRFVRWYGQIANADNLPSSEEYIEIAGDLLLVGSDKVIKANNELLRRSGEVVRKRNLTGVVPKADRETLMTVVSEMRRDLGYESRIDLDDLWTLLNAHGVMIGEPD